MALSPQMNSRNVKNFDEAVLKKYVRQENGQIIFLSPLGEMANHPKGTEVYVSSLPVDLKIYDIVPLFYSCGEIHSARLMMDFSGVNRGFAYIRYMTVDGANNAIRKMNSYEIRVGRKIKVTKSVDNCRLFIGRIDKTLTKEEIQEKLESLTDGVKDIMLYLSSTDKDMNRGFCFVEYIDHKSAAMARRRLFSQDTLTSLGEIKVDWATPENDIDKEIMPRSIRRKTSCSDKGAPSLGPSTRSGLNSPSTSSTGSFQHYYSMMSDYLKAANQNSSSSPWDRKQASRTNESKLDLVDELKTSDQFWSPPGAMFTESMPTMLKERLYYYFLAKTPPHMAVKLLLEEFNFGKVFYNVISSRLAPFYGTQYLAQIYLVRDVGTLVYGPPVTCSPTRYPQKAMNMTALFFMKNILGMIFPFSWNM